MSRETKTNNRYNPKAIRASLELLKITQMSANNRMTSFHEHALRQRQEPVLILPMNLCNELRMGLGFDDNSKGTSEQKEKRLTVMRERGYKRILHILSTDLLPESRELYSMDEYIIMARYLERLSFHISRNRDHYCLLTSGYSRLRERLEYFILSYGIEVRSRMRMYNVAPAA